MCRNIKPLFNFIPPASDEEIRASVVQFVRKISGFKQPSRKNENAFQVAVSKIETATQELLESLVTDAPPKHRDIDNS